MTDSNQSDAARILAETLLDANILSQAQIELAIADQEINDIPLEEILLVRGWITQEKLYDVAPWLKPGSTVQAPPLSNKTGVFGKPSLKTSVIQKPDLSKFAKPNGAADSAGASGTKTGSINKPDLAALRAQAENAAASAGASSQSKESSGGSPANGPGSANRETSGASPSSSSSSNGQSNIIKESSSASSSNSTNGSNSASSSSSASTTGSDTATKPNAKPADLPKEPPSTPAGEAVIHLSPVKSEQEVNLKAYKEVLKKILAVEKD